MKRLKLRFGINPIIVKELRSRMRGARAFFILTGVLLLMGGTSYLLYRMALATVGYYYSGPLSPQIGQSLFLTLAFMELLMVCTVAPAVTAGAISSEQEKLTYEMLLTTPLHPASILWGKLVSALSYVFLLIFAAVPMASLFYIFGGVTLRDMIKALAIVVIIAVAFGVLGLFMSALLKRTSRATVISYLIVAAFSFGTIFVYMAAAVIRQGEPPRWLLVPSPISALFSAIAPTTPYGGSPIGILNYLGMSFGGNWGALAGTTVSYTSVPRPIYHYTLPFYGMFALLLYLISNRLILPTRRWRVGWKSVLAALALLLAFGGLIAAAFFATADRYERAGPPTTPAPVEFFEGAVQVAPAYPEVVSLQPTEAAIATYPPPTATPWAYPAPPLSSGLQFTESDQVMVYAAVVRELSTDYFASDFPESGVIYLVQQTNAAIDDPTLPVGESQQISEALQQMITDLANLPLEIRWVGMPEEVSLDEGAGTVAGGGVIITLSNPYFQINGTVVVSASLYFSSSEGLGKTYLVERREGIWQVIGNTGAFGGGGGANPANAP